MKQYLEPEMDIFNVKSCDVIITSGPVEEPEDPIVTTTTEEWTNDY